MTRAPGAGPVARWLRRIEMRHRAWRYRVRIDPAEVAWMRRVLQPGDTVVDIGAYKGGYTFWMRHAVGAEGHVVSFEPQPELAAFLTRMVDAFGWDNVTVCPAGVSREDGERTLHAPRAEPTQGASMADAREETAARSYTVPVRSLDGYLAEREERRPLRFIKCDVEGHELDAFQGAEQVLREDRPVLLFECEARHLPRGRMRDVFDYLEGLGYRGSFFLGDERRPLSDFRVEAHQVEGRRPYANNFAFEPPG